MMVYILSICIKIRPVGLFYIDSKDTIGKIELVNTCKVLRNKTHFSVSLEINSPVWEGDEGFRKREGMTNCMNMLLTESQDRTEQEKIGKAILWSWTPQHMYLLPVSWDRSLLPMTSVYGHVIFTLGIWEKKLNAHWLHQRMLQQQCIHVGCRAQSPKLRSGSLISLSMCNFILPICWSRMLTVSSPLRLLVLICESSPPF